mmetsp:Transcript_27044/g.81871  ORF Transcript_27044/g.81871 Transcript_27044/m.81871 type:complete len:269 (-) Transcript_27044:976-1782(-)
MTGARVSVAALSPSSAPLVLCSRDAPLRSASSASPVTRPNFCFASAAMFSAVSASNRKKKCAAKAPSGACPGGPSTVHPREAPSSSRRLPNSLRFSLRVSSKNLAVSMTTLAFVINRLLTRSSATRCAACEATYNKLYFRACLGLRRTSGHSPERRRSVNGGSLANLFATTFAFAAARTASFSASLVASSLLTASVGMSSTVSSLNRLSSISSVMGSSVLGYCDFLRIPLAQPELPATDEPYAKSAKSSGLITNGEPVSIHESHDKTL